MCDCFHTHTHTHLLNIFGSLKTIGQQSLNVSVAKVKPLLPLLFCTISNFKFTASALILSVCTSHMYFSLPDVQRTSFTIYYSIYVLLRCNFLAAFPTHSQKKIHQIMQNQCGITFGSDLTNLFLQRLQNMGKNLPKDIMGSHCEMSSNQPLFGALLSKHSSTQKLDLKFQ